MTKPHTGFVYLAHLLLASRADAIAKLQIDGITLIPTTKRVYPRSWAASQVLGTVGWDDHGPSGLEYRYNSDLRGTNGERRIVNDAIGQPISIDDVRSTSPGQDDGADDRRGRCRTRSSRCWPASARSTRPRARRRS